MQETGPTLLKGEGGFWSLKCYIFLEMQVKLGLTFICQQSIHVLFGIFMKDQI